MIQKTDRVDVVLDVIVEADAYRVIVVGVYEPHESAPPMTPNAYARNVVQTFLGLRTDVRAFGLGRDGGDHGEG